MDTGMGEEGAAETNGENSLEAYRLTCVNRKPMKTSCVT